MTRRWSLGAALGVLTLLSCTDRALTGPRGAGRAMLVIPRGIAGTTYSLSGTSAVIDTIRIVLTKPPSITPIIDTSLFFPPGADSLPVALDVKILADPTFLATISYKAAGIVLFQASGTVTAQITGTGGGGGSSVSLDPILIGPGSDVTSAQLNPRDTVVSFGGSVTYRLSAFKAGGAPVTPFISVLTTSDQTVPITAAGVVTAPAARRTIWVRIKVPVSPPVWDSTRVTFAPVPTALLRQAGNAQSGTVNTLLAAPLTARVIAADALGVQGVTVTFSAVTAGASVTTATAITDVNGDATTTVRLATLAGAHSFTATSSVGSQTFTATASPGAPAVFTIVAGNGRTVVAGTPTDIAPSVRVTDAFGNPVPGTSVTFAVLTGGGTLAGATVTTNAAGVATLGAWTLGTTAGANTISASTGALTPLTFSATGVAGPAAFVTAVSGSGFSRTVASVVDILPTVRVTDAGGNPVVSAAVNFTALSGGGSATGTARTTDAAGLATLGTWTLGTLVGPNTITGQVGALTPVVFTITGTVGPAALTTKAGGDLRSAVVLTATDTAPRLRVTDTFGNPVSGVPVIFAVASGGGSIAGGATTTSAAGIAQPTSWTLGAGAGANTATATAAALAPVTFSATATSAAPAVLVKIAGDLQSATVGTAVAIAPRVKLTDASSNPIAGATVTFALVTTGGASVTGGTAVTDAGGFAQPTSWSLGTIAGSNSLSASSAGVAPVLFTATGTASAAVSIARSAGDGQTAVVNSAVAARPSVLVSDIYGNPVAGISVTFAVTGGGGVVTVPTSVTDAAGIASVGSWVLGTIAGANTLSATSGPLGTTFSATGVAASPFDMIVLSTDPQPGVVGTAVASPPSVRVRDAFGNSVPGVGVTFAVASGGGSLTGGGAVTSAGGVATVLSWTLGGAIGAQTLTASVSGIGSPTVFTANATAGSPASLVKFLGDGQSQAIGTPLVIPPVVRVLDSFGNPVAGATVTFAVVTGGGTVTGATPVSDAAGLAIVGSWTLGAIGTNELAAAASGAGSVTFTATGFAGTSPHIEIVSGDLQRSKGGRLLPTPIVARVISGAGAPVPGVGVAVSASGPGGGPILGVGGAYVSDAGGLVTFDRMRVGDDKGYNYVNFNATGYIAGLAIAFTTGRPTYFFKQVGVDSQVVVGGGAIPIALQGLVLDEDFNLIPGEVVSFTATGPSTGFDGPTSETRYSGALTDVAGLASWSQPINDLPGNTIVTATVAGLSPITFTVFATGVPVSFGVTTVLELVSGNYTSGPAGGLTRDALVVRARESSGRPRAGQRILFTLIGPALERFVLPDIVSDASGIATVTPFTLPFGSGYYFVEVETSSFSASSRFDVFAYGAPAQVEVVSGDGQSVAADAALAPVVVRVVDVTGVAIPGQSVAWALTQPSISGSPVPAGFGVVVTNALGQATIPWTSGSNAGTVTLTVGAGSAPAVVVTATNTGLPPE